MFLGARRVSPKVQVHGEEPDGAAAETQVASPRHQLLAGHAQEAQGQEQGGGGGRDAVPPLRPGLRQGHDTSD